MSKHCQWKIDGRQNGNDAGSESFELRFFLQGLRQKQHGWGAAWGIQKRFNQRFCIETVLTQKSSQGYCLEDVAILTHGKSSRRERPSCFSSWRWRSRSSPRCSNCISHGNYAARTASTKSRQVNSVCGSLPVFIFEKDDRSKFSLC